MPLQHSSFGPAVYSPHPDFLLKNVLVYPQKYLPVHIPVHTNPDVAVFDNDEWHPHYQPHSHHLPLASYSPPRIKQEDLPVYPAIPNYPSPHELLVQQPHRNYGLDHHHYDDTSQSFALFEGHHHSIPSQPQQPSHPTYYSPPFQNHVQIPRLPFEHHQSLPLSAAYVHPAELSPSVESVPPLSPYPDPLCSNTTGATTSWLDDERSSLSSLESDMVLSGKLDLDSIPEDMDASASVVSGMDIIAHMEDDAEGNEEDAEGEEDWSHIGADDTTMTSQYIQQPHEHYEETDSERDAGHPGGDHEGRDPIALVPPAPSEEEVSAASTSSSDEDFEDPTSEEEYEEEGDDDDDDDDEFVLNPRQRRRRSMSIVDSRRRSRGANGMSGAGLSANAAHASDLASNGFVPYSVTEGRSLRSRSMTGRYNPYPSYSDYYPEQAAFSGDLDSNEEAKPLPTTPGRRRTRPSSSLGVPVPVPNLTKKSRGRRVPTMSSLEDLRSAASGAGKKRQNSSGKTARMYLCDVEGCGKCFARGEHLKRHVRSIHTYEKPHKCPYPGCGKDFSRHDNLGQHMRVHKDYVPPASTPMRRKAQQA